MNREIIDLNQNNNTPASQLAPGSEDVSEGVENWVALSSFQRLFPEARDERIAVIPAEFVSVFAVTLPFRTVRQRAAALPFAIEDELGEALETTHVALGDGGDLAVAVSTEVMAKTLAQQPDHVVIAEQLLLARPEPLEDGLAQWVCYRCASRVLVRASDGTGFAARADMVAFLWRIAGQPAVESYGEAPPDGIKSDHISDAPPPLSVVSKQWDLRQGAFRPERRLGRPLKGLAAAFVLGAVSHLSIAAADARALRGIADNLEQSAQMALVARLPDAAADQPVRLIQRQLTAQNQPQRGAGFLPLMHRVSEALAGMPDSVGFRQLMWSEDALRVTLEAADLDALQRAEAELSAAGLQVSSGSATAEAGGARADLTVRP